MRAADSRPRTASSACSAAVRPKRASHACGIASRFSIVPVAVASWSHALPREGFESVSVNVSSPSSWASSSTGTDTVLSVSPGAKLSVPEADV